MSRLNAPAVAAQSVLVASVSASATSRSLAPLASACCASSPAKWLRRALSKPLRAALNRCQSADSVSRSRRVAARWCAFHSSSSSRMRAPLVFHWILFSGWPAIDSASATIASRSAVACGAGLGAVLLLDVALGGEAGLDLVELGGEGVEVADDGRVLDLRREGLEPFGDVLGRDLGLWRGAARAARPRRRARRTCARSRSAPARRWRRGRSRPRARRPWCARRRCRSRRRDRTPRTAEWSVVISGRCGGRHGRVRRGLGERGRRRDRDGLGMLAGDGLRRGRRRGRRSRRLGGRAPRRARSCSPRCCSPRRGRPRSRRSAAGGSARPPGDGRGPRPVGGLRAR